MVYAGSFSKILCPGLRLAYCAAQRELIDKMVVAKQGSDVHTNIWAQRVCHSSSPRPTWRRISGHCGRFTKKKAEFMMARLDRNTGGRASYVRPQGRHVFVAGPAGKGGRAPVCEPVP